MLSHEDNEYVTRVGPGTPMGELMREYWVPATLSSELPKPDSDPVRVMLLGEKLIAFRDTDGKVGLIQNHCPHRGASLFFGRNEEAGLRCVYHGWKFDVTGQCVDMPNEPAESNFKSKVKARAYPCLERNGLVWTYMGPRSTPPALPNLEANLAEGAAPPRAVQRECNYLQALEGDIDTSHFTFLHDGSLKPSDVRPGTFWYYAFKEKAPRYSVVDTEVGAMYGAYRDAEANTQYWRIAQYLFPFYTMPPSGLIGHRLSMTAWVPMDDDQSLIFSQGTTAAASRGPSPTAVAQPGQLTNTTDWFGRFRTAANVSNDFQVDRDLQRRNYGVNGFTGIKSVNMQDTAMTVSMGTIYDRSSEHLGTSDSMIIRVRRRLLDAARAHATDGTLPPGVDNPDAYLVRAGGILLRKDQDWLEATKALREPFSVHPELDPELEGRVAIA